MDSLTCLVCGAFAETGQLDFNRYTKVICERCGPFCLQTNTQHLLDEFSAQQKGNLSGWLREHPETVLTGAQLNDLMGLKTPSVGEKADKLLLFLAKKNPKPGKQISLAGGSHSLPNCGYSPLYAGVSWAQDGEELMYIVNNYLTFGRNFLAHEGGANFKIAPNGWTHVDSLRQINPSSPIAFVAMWFSKEVDLAWGAIEKGIRSAGYDALRIDKKDHNNKIDDEIVAGIRRSKFLVADFTGHRGGVYFEAGLATGLGLPVIWLCREDELQKTHFDTRQYNFTVWQPDRLEELTRRIQNRIEATIGRGPNAV